MNIPFRFLPKDKATLDSYADRYPELAEFYSTIADEETNPMKSISLYYSLLREDMARAS